MKKIIALALSALLLIGAAVVGTVAFLTDTDQAVNVMTSGNIDIEQYEMQRDGEKLVPFVNTGLWPAFSAANTAWEKSPVALGDLGNFNMYVSDVKNVKDKIVYVENTGKNTAFVRTVFAFENTDGLDAKVVKNWANDKAVTPVDGVATIGGVAFKLYVYDHAPIAPGKTSASLLQVAFAEDVTNEMLANINGEYKILSFTQAVQTEGFEDSKTALNRVFKQITSETHPWTDVTAIACVGTAAELSKAVSKGGVVILADDVTVNDEPIVLAKGTNTKLLLNGHTISGTSTASTTSYLVKVDAGASLTLSGNGTVTFRATTPDLDWDAGFPGYANNTISCSGKLVIDGATVENTTPAGGASYAIDCYPGADVTVNSGTVNGYDKVAIRMFANSATLPTNVTINGGIVEGRRAVWVQLPGSSATAKPLANLTVNGGTLLALDTTDYLAIYSYSYGNDFSGTTIALNGGVYYGHVALGGGSKNGAEKVTVNTANCTFYGEVYSYNDASGFATIAPNAKGGVVDNAADLAEKLEEGGNVILKNDVAFSESEATTAPYGNKTAVSQNGGVFDGNGNDVALSAGGDNYTVMTSGGTIKNLNVTGGFRGIMIMSATETIYLENVHVGGASVGYALNTGEGNSSQDLIVTNSSFYGWNSWDLLKSASFTDCTFGQGTYWGETSILGRIARPYVDTVFTNCQFNAEGYILDISELNGTIDLVNCTLNGTLITADNFATLVDLTDLGIGKGMAKVMVNGVLVFDEANP